MATPPADRRTEHDPERQIFAAISRVLSESLQLSRALHGILQVLARVLGARQALVALVEDPEGSGRLSPRASLGLDREAVDAHIRRLNDHYAEPLLRRARPFVIPDKAGPPLFLDSDKLRSFPKSRVLWFGAPITWRGTALGALLVDRVFGRDAALAEDLDYLAVIAAAVAQAVRVERLVEARDEPLALENAQLRAQASGGARRFAMTGKSKAMRNAMLFMEKAAPTNAPVLFVGERGVGKAHAARLTHELSARAKRPFIRVDCSFAPDWRLEAEIFGCAGGMVEEAPLPKPGLLEIAHKGTLFLDKADALPRSTQVLLHRALSEGVFERRGSVKGRFLDVRILAASETDLSLAVRQGRFHEELYGILSNLSVVLPPLRERVEDISALALGFLDTIAKEYKRVLRFHPCALEALERYEWPGNVRELERLIERLGILVEGRAIEPADLPENFSHLTNMIRTQGELPLSLRDREKNEVIAALERHHWVQTHAAAELGISLRQMGYRVKKYGLEARRRDRRARAKEDPAPLD